jgi:hypothetical protein
MRVIATLLMGAGLLMAQNAPRIAYLYPAGGRQGTSFEVTVGGQALRGVSRVFVVGDGVEASVAKVVEALNPGAANRMRDQLKELEAKPSLSEAEKQQVSAIRARLATFIPRPSSPAIADTVTLQVTIAGSAKPGRREVRLGAAGGLTNPMVFVVGDLPEVTRAPQRVPLPLVASGGATAPNRQPRPAAEPTPVTLPGILNGQIMPAATDRYLFHASKGQQVAFAAAARQLIPYISDAVPGWFQAALRVRDTAGRELSAADHYEFEQDPVLRFEAPADGDYVLEVHDSIYRGREDFVYRITAGAPAAVAMRPGKSAEKEPNDSTKKAQRLKLPYTSGGTIGAPGDTDVYRIDGRAGEEVAVEITARRSGSPLDSLLRLVDAAGKEIAANDDFEDPASGVLTHQADSRLLVKLPAKGSYYLHVMDTQGKGGASHFYRLRVSRPQPDFELRLTPASLNLRRGAPAPFEVKVMRRDGFAGEIQLRLVDAPRGWSVAGGPIAAGQDAAKLTLTPPPGRLPELVTLRLEGVGLIGGREIRREAVPAENMMQAFFYNHLVPAQAWMVRVVGNARGRPAAK